MPKQSPKKSKTGGGRSKCGGRGGRGRGRGRGDRAEDELALRSVATSRFREEKQVTIANTDAPDWTLRMNREDMPELQVLLRGTGRESLFGFLRAPHIKSFTNLPVPRPVEC